MSAQGEGAFVFPVSFAQRRLWFFDQLVPGSCVYNVPAVLRLGADVDAGVLARAVSAVVARHEALRTTFGEVDGEPVQVVAPGVVVPLEVTDLRGVGEREAWHQAEAVAGAEARRPFDLAAGPLMRTRLVRLRGEAVLLLTMHHIVSDGWSMGVLVREIRALYAAFAAGEPSPLPGLAIQYPDFAVWQRGWLTGEVLEEQLRYWRQSLHGAPLLELPADRGRPAMASFAGARAERVVPESLHAGLRELCAAEGLTLFMALLAGFAVVVSRWAAQDDLVIGTPIANRTRAELEPLIGFFINNLALRIDLSGDPSFRELAGRVREVALGAYAHQDLPFEAVVEDLAPARDLARAPLFNVMFILQNTPGTARAATGGHRLGGDLRRTAKFDLTVSVTPHGHGLAVSAEYATDLFDPATIERLLHRYELTLAAATARPHIPVSDLGILTPGERELVLHTWNRTTAPSPPGATLPQLFTAQASRTPAATAIRAPGQHLTYHQLAARSDRLAAHLARHGAQPGTIIGVCMERSLHTLTTILAILKTGAAYLPLDPDDPVARNLALTAAADVELVLADPQFAGAFPSAIDCEGIDLGEPGGGPPDRERPAAVSARSIAYIMHTSGSTGRPKGVMVEHQSLISYLTWFNREVMPDPAPALPFTSRPTVDASLKQLFAPLVRGAAVWVPAEAAARDPSAWPEMLIGQAGRLAVNCVPTFWGAVLAELGQRSEEVRQDLAGRLTHILLSGEPPGTGLLERTFEMFPSAEVWNLYGLTEITANATATRLSRTSSLTIGGPISNVRAYVLDERLRPVPVGTPGELCIAGAGLARGYLNDPALTAARFVPDPYGGPGERLYRTGDRARWRPAGTLEFLGRLDDQVKIRGFRVEPAEVRTALLEHPAVAGCTVTARTDLYPGRAEQALAAYLTPAGPQPPTAGELRRFAAARLPAHMVPAAYVILPRLPLTPSGKVDRAALPAPAPARPEGPARAPATPTERALASLWQAILGLDHITADDDFFALGGHSLLATQVISRIRRDLGTDLPLRRLFEHPTIASLAAELDRTPTTPPATHHIKPAPREAYWAPAPRRPGRPDATRAATGEDADPG